MRSMGISPALVCTRVPAGKQVRVSPLDAERLMLSSTALFNEFRKGTWLSGGKKSIPVPSLPSTRIMLGRLSADTALPCVFHAPYRVPNPRAASSMKLNGARCPTEVSCLAATASQKVSLASMTAASEGQSSVLRPTTSAGTPSIRNLLDTPTHCRVAALRLHFMVPILL